MKTERRRRWIDPRIASNPPNPVDSAIGEWAASNGSDADSPALTTPPRILRTRRRRRAVEVAHPPRLVGILLRGRGANSRRSTSTPGVLDGGLLVGGRFAASFSFMDVRRAASVGTSVSSSLTFVDASFAGDGVRKISSRRVLVGGRSGPRRRRRRLPPPPQPSPPQPSPPRPPQLPWPSPPRCPRRRRWPRRRSRSRAMW